MPPIQVSDLTKRFGSIVALRGVDLTVEENDVFALVGPNGAGKSTLIDVLLNYAQPSSGTVRVLGEDPQESVVDVHRRVGTLPQGFDVISGLTARQHLEYAIDANDADDDPLALLDRVGLVEGADQRAAEFSGGMKQRLALAMALVGSPELLVLDEPFTGIDPNGIRLVRSIVHEERRRGATVLLSSHDLSHVRELSTRIGIMIDGTIRATGSEEQLLSTAPVTSVLSIDDRVPPSTFDEIEDLDGVTGVGRRDEDLLIRVSDASCATEIRERLDGCDVDEHDPTLDDVFAYYSLDSESTDRASQATPVPTH